MFLFLGSSGIGNIWVVMRGTESPEERGVEAVAGLQGLNKIPVKHSVIFQQVTHHPAG